MLRNYLNKIIQHEDLTRQEAFDAMNIIMTGQATHTQIGSFLTALRMKGETIDEITGCAQAMRSLSRKIDLDLDPLIDTAGTGGDGCHTFNISTTAAFVIAGAGYPVAKHGNRAVSSKSGSADVLEALGINIQLDPQQIKRCIEDVGIGFMFAPNFHPAMKHAVGPRKELGLRTIFNILGPLTNPANATHQLLGVYDVTLIEPLAAVLKELGTSGAVVVHGCGKDEFSTNGNNLMSVIGNGSSKLQSMDPSKYGFRHIPADQLSGGDAAENAVITRNLLKGEDISPRLDIVVLNAAAAIHTVVGNFEESIERARESIKSGRAFEKLEGLMKAGRQMASQPV